MACILRASLLFDLIRLLYKQCCGCKRTDETNMIPLDHSEGDKVCHVPVVGCLHHTATTMKSSMNMDMYYMYHQVVLSSFWPLLEHPVVKKKHNSDLMHSRMSFAHSSFVYIQVQVSFIYVISRNSKNKCHQFVRDGGSIFKMFLSDRQNPNHFTELF